MKSFLHCCFVLCLAAGLALADVSDLKSNKSVESTKPSDKSSDSKPKRDASFLVGSSYHGPSFKYLPPSTSSSVYGGAHHGLGSSFGSSGHSSGHYFLPHGSHSYAGHSLGHHSGHSAGHYASHYGHSGLADVKYAGISHGSSLPSHSLSSSLGNHGFSGSSSLGGHHQSHSSGHGHGLSSGHGHGLSLGHVYGLSSGHGHDISAGHGHGLSSGHGHDISSGHGHGIASGHGHGLSSGHGHGLSSGHGHGISSGHGHGPSSGHGHDISSGHVHGLSSGHGHGISSGHGHGISSGHGHGLSSGHGHGLSSGHGHGLSSGHGYGSLGPAYTAGHGLLSSGSHSSHGAGGGLSHGGHSGHSYISSSSLGGSGLAHKPLTSHANVPSYNIHAGQVGTAAGLATGYHYAKGVSGSLPSSSHSTHSAGSTHLGSSGGVGGFVNHGIASHGLAHHGLAHHGLGTLSGVGSNELHHSDHVHNGNEEHHYIVSAAHDDSPAGQSPSDDGYHYDAPSPVYLAPPTYQQPPHIEPSSSYGVPLATIGGSYAPIYHGQSLGDESPVYAAGHKGLGHFTYTPNKPSVLHTSFVDSGFKAPNYSNAPFKPSTFLGSKVEGSSYAQEGHGHGPSLQYLTPSGSGAESNGYDYPVPAHSLRDSEYQSASDNATPIHEPESTYVPANNLEQSYNDISSNPSANYSPSNGEHSYGTQQ